MRPKATPAARSRAARVAVVEVTAQSARSGARPADPSGDGRTASEVTVVPASEIVWGGRVTSATFCRGVESLEPVDAVSLAHLVLSSDDFTEPLQGRSCQPLARDLPEGRRRRSRTPEAGAV